MTDTGFDERARFIIRILGDRLNYYIENERYLISRGMGNPLSLELLERAKELKEQADAT